MIPNSSPPVPPSPPENPEARFCLAVLLNDRDEILLLRRARDDSFAPGIWGFPGGHIHGAESPEETIRREMSEELGDGLALQAIRRLGPLGDTLYGGIFEVHLFLFRYEGGPLVLNGEHEAFAWVSREAYRSYAVVDGIDEDLLYLDVWPREWLNRNKLP